MWSRLEFQVGTRIMRPQQTVQHTWLASRAAARRGGLPDCAFIYEYEFDAFIYMNVYFSFSSLILLFGC